MQHRLFILAYFVINSRKSNGAMTKSPAAVWHLKFVIPKKKKEKTASYHY